MLFVFLPQQHYILLSMNEEFLQNGRMGNSFQYLILSRHKNFVYHPKALFSKDFQFYRQYVDDEWREYAFLELKILDLDHNIDVEPNQAKVFKIKDALEEQNCQKKYNTDHRNKFDTEAIASLMQTKYAINRTEDVSSFEPTKEIISSKVWPNINKQL